MTGLCHESSEAIGEAARWLTLTTRERIGRPIVPALCEQFGLTVMEAVQAVKEADRLRGGANGTS